MDISENCCIIEIVFGKMQTRAINRKHLHQKTNYISNYLEININICVGEIYSLGR